MVHWGITCRYAILPRRVVPHAMLPTLTCRFLRDVSYIIICGDVYLIVNIAGTTLLMKIPWGIPVETPWSTVYCIGKYASKASHGNFRGTCHVTSNEWHVPWSTVWDDLRGLIRVVEKVSRGGQQHYGASHG